MPDLPEIESGDLVARFDPAMGGRMTSLVHRQLGDILVPISTEAFDPLNWPRAGAYPLFPFHNRLRGACFALGDKSYHMAAHPSLNGDVMHGPSHRRGWHVAAHGAAHIALILDYDADEDWPFSFHTEQQFTLMPDCLIVDLKLINRSTTIMPGGIGWHPYFAAGENKIARSDAKLAYPLDTLDLPTGAPATPCVENEIDVKPGRTIHLRDWECAELELDSGMRLRLSTSASLEHLAVHRTAGYVCLEPVSHAAGALNANCEQRLEAGVVLLQPDEALLGRVELSFDLRDRRDEVAAGLSTSMERNFR